MGLIEKFLKETSKKRKEDWKEQLSIARLNTLAMKQEMLFESPQLKESEPSVNPSLKKRSLHVGSSPSPVNHAIPKGKNKSRD